MDSLYPCQLALVANNKLNFFHFIAVGFSQLSTLMAFLAEAAFVLHQSVP